MTRSRYLRRTFLMLGASAVVAACAAGTQWTKPGATAAEIARAEQDCTRPARVMFHGYGGVARYYEIPAVDADCMRARGFRAG